MALPAAQELQLQSLTAAYAPSARNLRFLADRTNGCAYATMLCPSVVCLLTVVSDLWLNGASS